MFKRRHHYRVREGSVADYARVGLAAVGFWAMFFAVMVTTYPL